MQNINTLHQLLEDDMRKFIVAEKTLQHTIPLWIKLVNSVKLKTILLKYFDQIKDHVTQMDKYFESEELQFVYNNHKVMATLVSDSEERILRCEDFTVKDACILSCIQNINHYKIGCYGTAAAFSNVLGKNNIALLFHQFEVNEKQIDDRLSQLAEYEINNQAIMHLPSNK